MKTAIALLICATAAVGCSGPADDTNTDPQLGQTGLNLRSDILADTDVAGMAYTIAGVDCETGAALEPAVAYYATRDLEDILLPGGHPGFEDRPFDADSEHLFADAFQLVPAGCYDVTAQPVDADGALSEDCAPASEAGVQVTDGQTTEIMLISQCVNDPMGAIDAIAALNHAPQLLDARYEPSKFTCGESTRICVSASDPDSDPLVLTASGPDGVGFELLAAEVDDAGVFTQCVTVTVPGPGEFTIDLRVFDQMYDADGALITVESVVAAGGQTSHDAIAMPVHAMPADACVCDCPDGFDLNDAGTSCERFDETDAEFLGNERAVCEGDDRNEYGALGAKFPGGLEVRNAFFGDGFDDGAGRLNAVGIWDCGGVEDEWIGFSACVNVEQPGEYVIGLAGDDNARLKVDGLPVFAQAGQGTFRSWHMVPVQLSAGAHIIELQGLDVGVAATLGAEIYGPFAVGSTATDDDMAGLDYANNIFWSTANQLGGVFDSGQNSGYSCPDGFGLNLCGDVATCTVFEERACN